MKLISREDEPFSPQKWFQGDITLKFSWLWEKTLEVTSTQSLGLKARPFNAEGDSSIG